MAGFFDIPFEIRSQILSLAVAPAPYLCGRCDRVHEPDYSLRMGFSAPGQKATVSNSDSWNLLRTVSLVSKEFAREARPHFFRGRVFIIYDSVDAIGQKNRLGGLQGFLSWVRVEEAEFLKEIIVQSGMNGHTMSVSMVLNGLMDVEPEKISRLGNLEVDISGRVYERATSASGVFRLDERGQWRVVKWKPFVTYE